MSPRNTEVSSYKECFVELPMLTVLDPEEVTPAPFFSTTLLSFPELFVGFVWFNNPSLSLLWPRFPRPGILKEGGLEDIFNNRSLELLPLSSRDTNRKEDLINRSTRSKEILQELGTS